VRGDALNEILDAVAAIQHGIVGMNVKMSEVHEGVL
jgi:hypothetical protein